MRTRITTLLAVRLLMFLSLVTVPIARAEIAKVDDIQAKGPWVDVRLFGTITFGSAATDTQKVANAQTIQNAIESAPGGGVRIQIPPGVIYVAGDRIKIRRDRIHIRGAGVHVTDLVSDGGVVFDFGRTDGGMVVQCSIADLSFVGKGMARKVAIRVTDVSEMEVRRITTGPWTGGGSIGLQYRGRDTLSVETVHIYADRPVSVEDNPNSTIDIDHAHFEDCYLGAMDAAEANVRIASGVNLTDVLFDGYQAWVQGRYGFYWHDESTTFASIRLSLKNIRYEQPMSPDGYGFYLSHNYMLNGFTLEGAFWGGGKNTKGIYLRNVRSGVIRDSIYAGTAEGLNIDGSVDELSISNSWFQAGSVQSVTGQNVLFSTPPYPASTGFGDTVLFGADTRPEYMKFVTIMGTRTTKYTGRLEGASPGWLVTVPGGKGSAYKVGMIRVAGSDDGGTVLEGGSAIFNKSGIRLLDHTPNFGAVDLAGKLSVIWQNGSTIAVKNRLGVPVDLVLSVDWQ